jgi:uncharacterized protein (TIGR02466 family)
MNNQKKFVVFPLFSVPLYHSSVGSISQQDLEQAKNSNYSYRPDGMFFISDIEQDHVLDRFPDLSLKVLDHATNYIHNILRISNQYKFKFSNSWLTKFPPKSYSPGYHNHCFSLFSGVLYLDSKDKGGITFSQKSFNNSLMSMSFDFELIEEGSHNIFNAESWTINPDEGDILLFPSSLNHSIMVNNSNADRYSIAFNIVPVGQISTEQTSKLHYE